MASKRQTSSARGRTERPRRAYLSQSEVPRHSITEALRVARAISDEYGKQPTRPLDVAAAMGMKPTTGKFHTLTGASIAYGFTEGGAQADEIKLTALGRRVVAPQEEGDDLAAKREALLRPRVIGEFLRKYDGSKIPRPDIGRNVLEGLGVPAGLTERTFQLIVESSDALGLLREIKGDRFVNLRSVMTPNATDAELAYDAETTDGDDLDDAEATENGSNAAIDQPETETPADRPRPNAIFLGHGKNRRPVEQLQKTLDQLGIPHKSAIEEANTGRPISQKVKETMEQCGAAILVFTADEELQDKEGNTIWRPSENVVHELGAAGVLYENRIIVFKEDSVSLATNYRDIGYISFEKDKLDAKVNDLLRELFAFKILKVSVGG